MKESDQHQTDKLISFFKEKVAYLSDRFSILALRPKHLPTKEKHFEGDFDYLILKEEFKTIFTYLYESCKNKGINFRFIQKFPNKKKFYFFIEDQKESITVEFWTAIEYTLRNQLCTFDSESIFETIAEKTLSKPEVLTLIYLTHLYHKQKNVFSTENQYRFKVFFNRLEAAGNTMNSSEAFQLLKNLEIGTFNLRKTSERAVVTLTDAGVISRVESLHKVKHYSKALWKKLFFLHRTIPVVGPDGVGKGIVSENSLKKIKDRASFRFKDLYRMRIFYKHLVLRFFNPKNLKKNRLDEDLGYYIFLLSSVSIYVLPIYLKGKKVLLDRYFLDYYATPIRYLEKGQVPEKLKAYPVMLYLTPTPDKMIFMGCQNDSLIERKNELSQVAVDYLQLLYIEFILEKKIPETLFISTENEIPVSVKTMQDFLLEG